MSVLFIGVVVLATTVGDLLVTRGMKETGEVHNFTPVALVRRLGRALLNRFMVAGIFCLAISFVAFLGSLAVAPVSLVVPATAATYLAGTLGAKWFLREEVSIARWLGTLIVLGGILLISLG